MSLALNEGFASAWFNLGVAYANSENILQAFISFKKASEIDPEDSSIWMNLGQTCEDMDDFLNALKYYKKAISLDEESLEAYLACARCYDATENNLLAKKCLNDCLKIFPA